MTLLLKLFVSFCKKDKSLLFNRTHLCVSLSSQFLRYLCINVFVLMFLYETLLDYNVTSKTLNSHSFIYGVNYKKNDTIESKDECGLQNKRKKRVVNNKVNK